MKQLPIADWEALIKNGRGQEVKNLIRALNLSKVERSQAAPLANLAHRLNLPMISIRVLNPIVRPKTKAVVGASEVELCEYAIGLNRLGLFDEASEILEKLDPTVNPRVNLYRAFVAMSQWHYQAAVPHLRAYIAQMEKEPYQKLIAQVNLSACLVFQEKTERAEPLLGQVLQVCKESNYTVLYGNANELMGQVALLKEDFTSAERYLREGQLALQGSHNIGAFFIEKWQTILKLRRDGWDADAHATLAGLKTRALELKHWETLRDCDYAEALLTRNEDLIGQLYFGTPYKEFRARLRAKFDYSPSWKTLYARQLGEISLGQKRVLISEGCVEGGDSAELGSVLHQLLFTLSKDFYRPFRLGSLFAALYPGEYFDPESSYQRVHKSIQRLRAWFEVAKLPLDVSEESGFYQLRAHGSVQLVLDLRESLPSPLEKQARLLREKFPRKAFTINEACECLGLAASAAQLVLKQLLVEGSVQRQGKGRATMYLMSRLDLKQTG